MTRIDDHIVSMSSNSFITPYISASTGMSTIHDHMLLSQVGVWVRELERAVTAYEAMVEEVEGTMERAEQTENVVDIDGQDVQQLERALESVHQLAEMVHAADAALCDVMTTTRHAFDETSDTSSPERNVGAQFIAPNDRKLPTDRELPDGSVILQGRYCIIQLLHHRPRVNLYLARRLSKETQTRAPDILDEPLVAIRELVLTGLTAQECKEVERAAFEEFVSPAMLGSPRLPGAGDRIQVEGERHYLVMQLRRVRGVRGGRGSQHAIAITLSELLLSRRQWPLWLDVPVALDWAIQLCRIVARLHRLGVVLGDLHPATVLVDREGPAEWAPVLLISWPPAPQFWPEPTSKEAVAEQYTRLFPTPHAVDSAFAAPEMLGGECTERSDVYSLGALLYLFLTRYAPASPTLRQQAMDVNRADGMALIPLHLFNSRIPTVLEEIVLRALALAPEERYASVFELVEALESVELAQQGQQNGFAPAQHGIRRVSKVRQVVEWLKQELNS